MENLNGIRNGDTLAAANTGADWKIYRFFWVIAHTASTVTLQEVEKGIRYDDGKPGPHYYDDPYHVFPRIVREDYVLVGDPFVKKVKYNAAGKPVVCHEGYVSVGVYDNRPLEEYNYH